MQLQMESQRLVEIIQAELLGGVPLVEYLGASWLGVCGVAHKQCERVQCLLQPNAI